MAAASARVLLLVAAAAAIAAGARAAEIGASSSPRFVRLSTQHGLSQDTVTCILQDHRRFLWFGTEEGLKVVQHVAGQGGSAGWGHGRHHNLPVRGVCRKRLCLLFRAVTEDGSHDREAVHHAGARHAHLLG